MTVRELIEALGQFPTDMEVGRGDSQDGPTGVAEVSISEGWEPGQTVVLVD